MFRGMTVSPHKNCMLLWILGFVITGCGSFTASRSPVLNVAEPSSTEPVTAAMRVSRRSVRPGEIFEVMVRVRIADGHHIYGASAPLGPFSPTTLKLILPDDLEAKGDWVLPKPIITRTNEKVYMDSALFLRQVKVRLNALERPLSIKVELRCQACTDELCWPPREIGVSTMVAVENKTKK